MLLQRIGAKRPSAANRAVNGTFRLTLILHGYFDARSNRCPVGFDPDQMNIDPVVAASWIFEEPQGMCVRRYGAANLRENVLVAVAGQIGKRDPVSLVQFAGPRRRRDIYKRLSRFIEKQNVRQQPGKRSIS